MTRKLLWARSATAAVLAVGALAACSGSGTPADSSTNSPGSTGSAAGKKTITVWARDSNGSLPKVADEFNKTHPDLEAKVTLIPAANFVQKFGTAIANGSGPDVAAVDLVFTPYFASKGALADITDKVNALPYKDTLSKAHMAQSTLDGKLYAVPLSAEASVLYYNKTLFKKAGLDPEKPPTTYQQVIDYAKKITALGGDTKGYYFSGACAGCNIFTLAPYVWASGGDVLKDGKPTLNSPEVKDALNFYRQLWVDGSIPAGAKTDDGKFFSAPFANNNIGMVGSGAYFVGVLKGSKTPVDFGVAPLPGKTGGSSSFAGGDTISVASGAKNPDGAFEFLRWVTDDGQKFIAKQGLAVPIRSDIATSDYVPQDPRYKLLADQMNVGRVPYSVVENALFNDGSGPWSQMIQKAVFDGDVDAAQAEAQKAAEAIVEAGPGGS
ncbi:MAG TPA: sugar ABC transporter substrate-binding protein [Kineosporiaceae bacterium]|jgi:multiple sugar transport system substrate-binding protein|nr:sugar ABC transporter substrate-binding protein [Kineosporiaceae bacterium]